MSANTRLTILLVHGAWHGPWCWRDQIPALQQLGYDVETAQLPSAQGLVGATQHDDAAAVRAVLEPLLSAGRRVVVVAHSYGGPIGSAAIVGLSERQRAAAAAAAADLAGGVVGLVCLCAFILPGGMDQGAAIDAAGGLRYVVWDAPAAGLFVPRDPRAMFFPPDTGRADAEWAVARLRPQSMAANRGVVPPQAWQEDAEHYEGRLGYVACTEDRAVPFEDQKAMIAAAGGAERWIVRELKGSGHSPFFSRPKEVASVLHEIIEQFQKGI